MLDNPVIISTINDIKRLSNILKTKYVYSIEELIQNPPDMKYHNGKAKDIAFILFTSGSTGKPKGCIQTHHAVIARQAGTKVMTQFNENDIILNWMPLSHVGGLIGMHIEGVYQKCRQIHVPTDYILDNPIRWINLIDKYKATIAWAPNFAFNIFNNKISKDSNLNWDLSSMRYIYNAGESINPRASKKFLKLLSKYGLQQNSIKPVWGMSETCSGSVYSDAFTSDLYDGVFYIDQVTLGQKIKEVEIEENITGIVSLGKPMPGFSIKIVDSNLELLEEGYIGQLLVKGSCVTTGYYDNETMNKIAYTDDGWFITGDLAFISNGNMAITGRDTDVIIVYGINYNAIEIESAVEEIEGVQTSFTAACAVRSTQLGTDEIVLFYSSSYSNWDFVLIQINKIIKHILQKIGLRISYIIPLEQELIPKTSIGKIQKSKLKKYFEAGKFDVIIDKIKLSNKQILQNKKIELPTNESEKKLLSIWESLLSQANISVTDDFFEVGGSSINAASLVTKINSKFNVTIKLNEFFINSSIRKIAKVIETSDFCISSEIVPADKKDYYPLSPAQARIFYLQNLEINNTVYNETQILHLRKKIDLNSLTIIFQQLINRHEILRTSFYNRQCTSTKNS